MQIKIRRFCESDIPNKVKWINDPENNRFLHYDLPLEEEKTKAWFQNIKSRNDRFDAVIEADSVPCGLIGLLNIDRKHNKAEFYICMGERGYKGKGVASAASRQLLQYGFRQLGLNRIYLFTEVDNIPAQKLFEKVGFVKEGRSCQDLYSRGRYVDRYAYGICTDSYESGEAPRNRHALTEIHCLGQLADNLLYIKREDLIPYSFGGNKARKAQLFFERIDAEDCDCVVTYGSASSNHCRVVANMAAARNMQCDIISPEEASEPTFNSRFMELFGAQITVCPVSQVHDTIEDKLRALRAEGKKPYFIPGGGHGNIGTAAYVQCYDEIRQFEKEQGTYFDYVFFASGTGTTQAGLVCGQLIHSDERKLVGISIARKNPRGRDVVIDSIHAYLTANGVEVSESAIQENTVFVDDYVGDGYGKESADVIGTMKQIMTHYGIPLDSTYTGKAFYGMMRYMDSEQIRGKKILFIHTGGTPLFFDDLKNF